MECVSAEETGACFSVDLLVGAEDAGAEGVFGAAPRDDTLKWCVGDEEVLVDPETQLWREKVEEWTCLSWDRHYERVD